MTEPFILAKIFDMDWRRVRWTILDDEREYPWGQRIDVVDGELGWWSDGTFYHAGMTFGDGSEVLEVARYRAPEPFVVDEAPLRHFHAPYGPYDVTYRIVDRDGSPVLAPARDLNGSLFDENPDAKPKCMGLVRV